MVVNDELNRSVCNLVIIIVIVHVLSINYALKRVLAWFSSTITAIPRTIVSKNRKKYWDTFFIE